MRKTRKRKERKSNQGVHNTPFLLKKENLFFIIYNFSCWQKKKKKLKIKRFPTLEIVSVF